MSSTVRNLSDNYGRFRKARTTSLKYDLIIFSSDAINGLHSRVFPWDLYHGIHESSPIRMKISVFVELAELIIFPCFSWCLLSIVWESHGLKHRKKPKNGRIVHHDGLVYDRPESSQNVRRLE